MNELTSISISYWTDSRDIFVGSLVAVGFFLFSYNGQGTEHDSEFYLSKAACVFAICIALFPTTGFSAQDILPKWTIHFSALFGLKPQHIHYGSASLLFACLIIMMSFFSKRAMSKGKTNRANLYRLISILMALGIPVLYFVGYLFDWDNTVLYVEIWGLSLFGIGWLIAGTYRSTSRLVSEPKCKQTVKRDLWWMSCFGQSIREFAIPQIIHQMLI